MSEPRHHTKEVLNFTGLGYCYCSSWESGYGGFNWTGLIEYLDATYWQNIVTFWCDTGYQNVAAATGASAVGYVYQYGSFVSYNLKETFSLKSMVVASSWSANQEWTISAYTFSGGALHLKGSENFYANFDPVETLKFTSGLFKNISGVTIKMDTLGSPGNTCTYGTAVEGYQLAIGNLKIVWNGKIPTGHGTPHHAAPQHHATPAALMVHQASHLAASQHHGASHQSDSGYHSQLLALHHDPGGLTSQFNLPQMEHLGA